MPSANFIQIFVLILSLLLFSSCASLRCPLLNHASAFEGIDVRSHQQLVEVVPYGTKSFQAIMSAWDFHHGVWKRKFGPWPVVIGRTGFAKPGEKMEGDGHTPSGDYLINLAFGRANNISTGLNYRQATDTDVWVDDVASSQYNQWVKKPVHAASFEEMLRKDGLYDIGAVIEYNTAPVIPGKGSAIFIHVWREHGTKPTAGCVALNSRNLRRLLEWLNKEANPVIRLRAY